MQEGYEAQWGPSGRNDLGLMKAGCCRCGLAGWVGAEILWDGRPVLIFRPQHHLGLADVGVFPKSACDL